jgi:choline dehydrogenase-like flavoprotein
MIIDLSRVQSDPFAGKDFDVCIIGAGVAGISLALHLSRRLRILLLEGGGFENSVETMDVYAGESVGQDYFDLRASRLRFFGGSSNHWGGDCRMLDDVDFEARNHVEFSGWPIRRSDLEPYLLQAESILDLPEGGWDLPGGYFEDKINQSPDMRGIRYKFSPPTRFGEKYRQEIEGRENLFCLLNANVTEFRLRKERSRLRHVTVRDYAGNSYEAQANTFVLAAGGIENPRLMLNSDRQVASGLGNEKGRVGQFFTDHLYAKVGDFVLAEQAKKFVEQYPFGSSFKGQLKTRICAWDWLHSSVETLRRKDMDCLSEKRRFFAPTPELMERDGILNFSLRMRVRTPGHDEAMDGKLFIAAEQAPNPQSAITLGADTDQLGLRRVRLDWRLSRLDVRTLRVAAIRFGEALAGLSVGRLKVADWLNSDPFEYVGTGGHHHMCTTRMGDSPEDAVVDANQKVFGIDNLYVTGSSVFSTGGAANPTLSIVQLTLRLAEHLSAG